MKPHKKKLVALIVNYERKKKRKKNTVYDIRYASYIFTLMNEQIGIIRLQNMIAIIVDKFYVSELLQFLVVVVISIEFYVLLCLCLCTTLLLIIKKFFIFSAFIYIFLSLVIAIKITQITFYLRLHKE